MKTRNATRTAPNAYNPARECTSEQTSETLSRYCSQVLCGIGINMTPERIAHILTALAASNAYEAADELMRRGANEVCGRGIGR